MKPYQLKLAAKLLRMASEEFSCHGCNDFDLQAQELTEEEMLDFVQTASRLNHDDLEQAEDRLRQPRYAVQDWEAMIYLAKLLEDKSAVK